MRTALIILAVLATASTSTASYLVVTSKNIENGTIQPVDLSAKTKRALRGRIGPHGPVGSAGLQGQRGAQGERGLVLREQAYGDEAWVAPGYIGTSVAICTSGAAVAGGFVSWPPNSVGLAAVESRAYTDTIWRVRMKNIGNSIVAFEAQATCMH